MKRKVLELKHDRATLLEAAEKALASGDKTAYDTAMKDIAVKNGEIADIEKLLGEKERFTQLQRAETPHGVPNPQERQEDAARTKQLHDLRKSNEYVRSFCKAIRNRARVDDYREEFAPLYKAMTLDGGTVSGEDGGFLVPIDFDTRVQMLAKDYFDLSTLVHVETVSVDAGWRNVETSAARTKLPKIAEGAAIGKDAQPKFKRIEFNCDKYGDRIAISGELMEDADGLMNYLAAWWTPKYILTKNALILSLLADKLTFTAFAGSTDAAKVKEIKSVLNKGLNTAHSRNATLLTNAVGYDEMDNWNDAQGRPLLVPDLSGDFSRFKGRAVRYADVDEIPNITTGTGDSAKTYAPLYIGNFSAFASLFLRSGLRIDATSIGGDAWATAGTEIRAICRMAAQAVDTDAVVARGWATT